jgi:tetratricopeptide (TPR) repeat protein
LALDREDTLKKAEKLLRQGRLEAAIAEYVRVVEDQPRDWNTANMLGDLYARAAQSAKAVAQYARIADHFFEEGFYPKAAALYKKILKLTPDDEGTQLKLAEISATQGLLADAKSHFNSVAGKRRARGDTRGADEIVVRLGDLDPADLDARQAAARVLAAQGDAAGAAARFRALHDDLAEKGRAGEARDALREAVRLDPADLPGRALLAKEAVAAGDFDGARAYLDRDTAGSDPALLLALAELELRSGRIDEGRDILPPLVADAATRARVMELAWSIASTGPAAAFACVDVAVDASTAAGDYEDAAAALQEFVTRVPEQIPALLKLVEVCVDGGLETTMYEAQAQLADAYLSTGQAAEARVIAEDLVAREPWERAHIERFRRALVMLRVPEPDSVIAERLSGQSPFMATDPFADTAPPPPVVRDEEPPAESPAEAVVEGTVPEEPYDEPPAAVIPIAAQPPPPAASAPAPPKKTLGPMEIDLTSVLGDLQAPAEPAVPVTPPPRANLDEVFKDFRREVSRQSGADQSVQHMKLAETYLEMGMADEAIAALKVASRSPRLRFRAASILGRIYREQGDAAQASEWLERAAEAPAPDAEQGRALLYDLGVTLQSMNETARALAVFLELQADAGEYRDVSSRVEHLSRVQTGG